MNAANAAGGEDANACSRCRPHRRGNGRRASMSRCHDGRKIAEVHLDSIGCCERFELIVAESDPDSAFEDPDRRWKCPRFTHGRFKGEGYPQTMRSRKTMRDERGLERNDWSIIVPSRRYLARHNELRMVHVNSFME
jgi:hypothetical protein